MSNAVWITMWNVASFILQPGDPMLPNADNTSSSNNKLRLILVLMELYVTPVNCFITESVLLILFTTPTHETGQNIVTELFLRTSNFAELFLMIFLLNQKAWKYFVQILKPPRGLFILKTTILKIGFSLKLEFNMSQSCSSRGNFTK